MRAKLINGSLVHAPRNITIGNITYKPATDEQLASAGWKEVIYTKMPTDATEDHHYESSWRDGKQITQVWTLVEDEPATICARLREWFDNEYREDNEKLTRFAALGIDEVVVDDIRGKEYHNLMELYAEAEIVRAEIKSLENGGDAE